MKFTTKSSLILNENITKDFDSKYSSSKHLITDFPQYTIMFISSFHDRLIAIFQICDTFAFKLSFREQYRDGVWGDQSTFIMGQSNRQKRLKEDRRTLLSIRCVQSTLST